MDAKASAELEDKKTRASAWFGEVRDRLVGALEAIEDTLPPAMPLADRALYAMKNHGGRSSVQNLTRIAACL